MIEGERGRCTDLQGGASSAEAMSEAFSAAENALAEAGLSACHGFTGTALAALLLRAAFFFMEEEDVEGGRGQDCKKDGDMRGLACCSGAEEEEE
jgi:hypothetical protein